MHYEIEKIRHRFPALSIQDERVARIYFDNPAGTQVVDSVIESISKYFIESNANIDGSFVTSHYTNQIMDNAHQAAADFLNALPDEIIFGQNMTTLTFHVSRSIGRSLKAGDEILLSRMDHDANISPWLLLAKDLQLNIKWLPFNLETYEFDLVMLDNILTQKTKLVCIGGASNLIGTINDIKTISTKARDIGAISFIDAVQLAPHVSIDVQDIGCDFLACSAYKFFGPHQGILWGRKEMLESLKPYKLRPAPSEIPGSYETGTQNHEGMAGTTAAIDYFAWIGKNFATDYCDKNNDYRDRTKFIHAALDYFFEYENILTSRLIDGLNQFPNLKIHGIKDKEGLSRRVPTVAFTVDNIASEIIAMELGRENIFVWSGHNYAVEVVKALGIYESGGAVRVGPVHYNTTEEIDNFLNTLEIIITKQSG
tara:strand:+ start:263 stop:1540 length:1278 start_codon:yes stop_codon:yes gene_type:complete